MPTRFIAELLGRQICLASDLCTTASGAASATRRREHNIAWARVSSCVGVRTSMPASCSTRSSIWRTSPSSRSAAAASEKMGSGDPAVADRAFREPFVEPRQRVLGARDRQRERAPIEFSDGCAREHHCLGSLPSLLIVSPACSSRCRVCGIRASVAASRWLQRGPRAAASR
jgi:hypothetical protein